MRLGEPSVCVAYPDYLYGKPQKANQLVDYISSFSLVLQDKASSFFDLLHDNNNPPPPQLILKPRPVI